jgi:hypothetical protein
MSSHSNRQKVIIVKGRVLSGEEQIKEYCEKNGLCTICGQFQTHKKVGPAFNRQMEPITVEDESGNVTVYKGHCIQATCYSSVEQVKGLLGEIPKKMPRSTPPVSPAPIKVVSNSKSPSSLSLGTQRRLFHGDGVYVPPMVPNLEREGLFHLDDASNLNEGDPKENHSGYLRLKTSLEGLPPESEIKSVSKGSALLQKDGHRLRSERRSKRSESESSVSFFDPESSGSYMSGSIRSSFQSSEIGSSKRELPREHSQFLLDSSSSEIAGATLGTQVDEGCGVSAADELKAQILEGDYVKFLGELDIRRGTNVLDEGEKTVVLEGLQLFRYHVVKDQLSKPNGVILPGENWVKTINMKLSDCSTDKDIVMSSLLTLLTLSALPGNYKKCILKKGGIDGVMKFLDSYKGDGEVPAIACSVFVSLGLSEKEGLNAKFDKIAPLLKRLVAMIVHSEWGRDFALRALFHFAFHRRRASETNKSLSHDVKYFLSTEAALKALFAILGEEGVRETAIESSLSLIWRLSGPKDHSEEVDLLPISAEAVNAVVMAMETFDSAAIREAGCGILANMAMRETFPSEMTEPALMSIHRFLQNSTGSDELDEGLVTCAMHAICNMLADASMVYVSRVRIGIIEAVLEVIKLYSESHELIEFACLIIAHASRDNYAMKESVVVMGGFDLVKASFEEFVTKCVDEPILEVKDAALCALVSLTGCRRGAEAILQSGLLEVLQTLLAIETDKDFADLLELVVKNTENCRSSGFLEGAQSELCARPEVLEECLVNATSDAEVASILQTMVGIGQCGLDVAVRAGEGCSTLTAVLSHYRNSWRVQESGCLLIAAIYFHVPYPPKIIEGIIEGPWDLTHQRKVLLAVDRAMDVHRENVEIQINGCMVILNLMAGLSDTSCDRSAANSMMERCLTRVLEVLLVHDSVETIQKGGMAALGACVYIAEETILQRWNARIVRQLFESISRFSGFDDIQLQALDVVVTLLGLHQGFDSIGSPVGIGLLLDLLGSNIADLSVRAAAALASLVENDFMATTRIMELPHSIPTFLLGMSANQEDLRLQVCISTILESLVNNDSEAGARILQNEGVSTLCNLMSIHRRNEEVVIHTCNILSSILQCLDANAILFMSDLLKQSLIEAFQIHVENADVEASVFSALWVCCQKFDLFKRLLLEESRIRMILSAMQLNIGSSELQKSGCSLLWLLMRDSTSGKQRIGTYGGIPTVVNALLAHNESTAVQVEGLLALKYLAMTSNKRMLAEVGCENAVMCSLFIHYNDPEVISTGLSVLNNIAVESQTRSVTDMNEQALSIVIAAMSRFPHHADVHKNACSYLRSCSCLQANLVLMRNKREQLIPLLLRAAGFFPEPCGKTAGSVVNKLQL